MMAILMRLMKEWKEYMYWYTKHELEDNGFIHYEISNLQNQVIDISIVWIVGE